MSGRGGEEMTESDVTTHRAIRFLHARIPVWARERHRHVSDAGPLLLELATAIRGDIVGIASQHD
jgi:hypothetical protein